MKTAAGDIEVNLAKHTLNMQSGAKEVILRLSYTVSISTGLEL
jgi:hypothetical protein